MPNAEKFSTAEILAQCLKSHDWYYGYSDDHRVWSRGEEEHRRIYALYSKLSDEIGEEGALEVWNENAPLAFKRHGG